MLEFVRNASVLKLWQRLPLMPSTTMPFCTSCANALFAKPHLACPVQICIPCPIYCCSMPLARHAQASDWHAVEHAALALLQHQAGSVALLCVRIRLAQCCASGINMAQCMLHIKQKKINYSSMLWIRHSFGLNIVASCIRNCDSILCIYDSMLSGIIM